MLSVKSQHVHVYLREESYSKVTCSGQTQLSQVLALMIVNAFQLTNVDVVRFPYGVLITEVRVIPPGLKAHSNLPDNRAFG